MHNYQWVFTTASGTFTITVADRDPVESFKHAIFALNKGDTGKRQYTISAVTMTTL